jgi:hypothetical protein
LAAVLCRDKRNEEGAACRALFFLSTLEKNLEVI